MSLSRRIAVFIGALGTFYILSPDVAHPWTAALLTIS